MRNKTQIGVIIFFVLSVSLISSSVTAFLLSNHGSRRQFQMLGNISQKIIAEQPEAQQTVLKVLKEYKNQPQTSVDENILLTFGYQENHFLQSGQTCVVRLAGTGFAIGALLFLTAFWLWHRRELFRIRLLTSYLENVNAGGEGLVLSVSEGAFSKLQDELYKTVTSLYQARDAALDAKNNFSDNLSNIAHQLKTPITAISLSTQMMKEQLPFEPSPFGQPFSGQSSSGYLLQIQKQLGRLTHLEEALLLLSRIDAGTLTLERAPVDVFTVLTLAADNLQEHFDQAGVFLDIPEMGELEITADLDWTMEAMMNLFKNCMEHTPPGKTVHCSYEQNPLYTQILIWDEGQGFSKEDISHLFERFYRGRNAKEGGIGIGLPLAKALIEMQNGIITTGNLPNGGACFEIRIYSH